MLTRKYDPTRPYRSLRYGRMSSDRQNPRSPDQQFDTIETTRARLGYPWVLVQTYRDDGVSGRYMRKRTGLQAMLRDIEVGLVQADLIEVDTLEQLDIVLSHDVDAVLLDNMTPAELTKAVKRVDGKCLTEASGGVNLDTVRAIAQSGVDLISVGALTHSAAVLDLGLDFRQSRARGVISA